MNHQIINMLEAIKTETYTSYVNYLNKATVERISKWFCSFALEDVGEIENIIGLMYELYVREDIDLRPYEDYTRLVSYLAEKYKFDASKFLDLYQQLRQMIFES